MRVVGGSSVIVSADTRAPSVDTPAQPNHIVQFYEDDSYLCDSVAHFIAVGLANGESVCVIATAEHREAFAARLARRGFSVDDAQARGQLVWLDAREMLAKFLVEDLPDWTLFSGIFGGIIDESRRREPLTCVRAYGEMVDVLWRAGNKQAALRLEAMWNELARGRSLSLLCAYVMGNFYRSGDAESFGWQGGQRGRKTLLEAGAGLRRCSRRREQRDQQNGISDQAAADRALDIPN